MGKMSGGGIWNQETKNRLNEKILTNLNDLGSLTRQILRGSKTNDLLSQAAKNFASQEHVIHSSYETTRKMDMVKSQLILQQTGIERSMATLSDIQDKLKIIQR